MQDTNWIEPEKITAGHARRRWAARNLDGHVLGFLSLIPFIILVILIVCVIGGTIAGITFLVMNVEGENISWMQNLSNYFVSLWSGVGVPTYIFAFLVAFIFFLILLCFLYLFLLSNALVVAACMVCFGNTPGKYLFGIKVLHETGRSITFKEAFKREMLVCFKGEGLCIPIINLFAMCRGYKNLKKHKITTWDKQMHLTVSYRIQPLWVRLFGVTILIGFMYTMYNADIVLKFLKNWLPSSGY